MKPNLALSTCWNSFRHTDGYPMMREIADMGFEYAELSHGIRIVLVPGILKALGEGWIKVQSTHNFCPLPTGVTQAAPNLFEPSAREHQEHEQWLRHTKRSIEFSVQVNAKAMVTHLGSTQFFWWPPSKKLKAYLAKHSRGSATDIAADETYLLMVQKACDKMRKRMPDFWNQVLSSLEEIRLFAHERGLKIGCENREKFEELPMDDRFDELFDHFKSKPHPFGYWHDAGHAQIKQEMGVIDHHKHLEHNAQRAIGFHLHDVSAEGRDHQPVGSGVIDFKMISQFWKPEHLLTLELSPRVSPDDVRRSRERILNLL